MKLVGLFLLAFVLSCAAAEPVREPLVEAEVPAPIVLTPTEKLCAKAGEESLVLMDTAQKIQPSAKHIVVTVSACDMLTSELGRVLYTLKITKQNGHLGIIEITSTIVKIEDQYRILQTVVSLVVDDEEGSLKMNPEDTQTSVGPSLDL